MRDACPRGALLLSVAFAVAALYTGGCGEDRNYQPGVAESAALDEAAYKAADTARREASAAAASASTASASNASSSSPKAAAAPIAGASAAPSASSASASGAASSDGAAESVAPAAELFEPDGITPSDAGRDAIRSVIDQLSLPSPPPVAEAPGEESYQRLARDRKFDEFRRKAARYVQLKKQLIPLGRKLGDGSATPDERALHNRIEDAISVEFKPLNRYMWDERWTEADRAAMGWILFVKPD